MKQNRILHWWRGAHASAPDRKTVNRLVATVIESDLPDAQSPVDEVAGEAEGEMLRLIASIRDIGTAAPPLDDAQVDAIMATLQAEASTPPASKLRELLGMLSGFLACALTLAMGLLLLGGTVDAGPSDIGAAALVASVAAAAALLLHSRSRVPHPLLPVLAVLTLVSCTSGPPESATVEVDPGALTVFEEGESLWGVRDVIQSGDAIWALTETEPFLRAYSPSGQMLAEFGSAGEGPGELRLPWSLSTANSADGVIVWDLASTSRPVFTASGVLESSRPAPVLRRGMRLDITDVSFGHPFRLAEKDDEILVVDYSTGPNLPDDFWSGRIVRFTGDASEATVLVDFAADLEGSVTRATGMMGLAPVPLWDRCPGGSVAVLDPVAGHLHLFDPDGASEQPISLPWSPRTLLREELLGYVRARMQSETRDEDVSQAVIERAAEEAVASAGDVLPKETPLGVDLLCSADRVWIQEFDGLAHPLGYGRAWRSVSVEDQAARFERVRFPDRFAPFQITDSAAIGVVTDSVGLQRVGVVRLPS